MALETVVRERDAQIRDLEARLDMRDAVASVHNGWDGANAFDDLFADMDQKQLNDLLARP